MVRARVALVASTWATLLAFLVPRAALACPQCAGRADGGIAQGVLLGLFILFPFAVVGTVWRFIRSEPPSARADS